MDRVYKAKDFKKLVLESSNEFKAKLGPNVESDNKRNNGKAYKDAEKRAKDYDGGLSDKANKTEFEKNDGNKTMLDLNPENATPEYKKRVHAQVKGYNSEQEMNNGIEKFGDFEGNEKIYNGLKKHGEEIAKKEKELKRSGLQARELPEKTFDRESMYESKNVKTVLFKKTEFLSEQHMRTRIPDDFKTEGTVFRMKDKVGNTYLLEWCGGNAIIMEHSNPKGAENALNRMFELMNYKSSDTETTSTFRLNENDDKFRSNLSKVRQLMK